MKDESPEEISLKTTNSSPLLAGQESLRSGDCLKVKSTHLISALNSKAIETESFTSGSILAQQLILTLMDLTLLLLQLTRQ